jgi:trimeric autotransporter adhesin
VNPATTNIVINPLPVVQFSANTLTGCVPLTVTLTDQSAPASSSVTWNFGDNTTTSGQTNAVTHTYNSAGCFDVTLTTTSNGCSNTATVQNYICAVPQADAGFTVDDQTQTISDPTFQFLNTSQNATSYSWEFGDGQGSSATNPSHTYENEAGSYTIVLVANNDGGCVDTARLTVQVEDELIFHVPNAFTPDGDEYNNTFQPVFHSGYDPFSFTMTIYNRWGEIVFETHDVTIGWDGDYNGSTSKEGVYTWTIQFKNTGSDKKSVYSGHFSLID